MAQENHIIIALGGRGGNCLKSFRKILYKNSLTKENAETYPIEYIYVDSDDEDLKNGWTKELGIDYSINDKSKINIREGNNFNDIISNLTRYPNISPWLGDRNKWGDVPINAEQGAGQLRRLGRVYFAANVTNNRDNSFTTVLSQVYQDVTAKSGDRSKTTYHIIAGLSGGTGSGTIIDTICLVSNFIKTNRNANDKILIYSLLPTRNDQDKDPLGFYYPNTYAAFKEINAIGLSKGNNEVEKNPLKYYPINISSTNINQNQNRIEGNFDTCFLFSHENENNRVIDDKEALPDLVGDFLYHSIIKLPLNEEGQDAYTKLTENSLIEEEVDEFSGARERAIKFASASIKRIAIPEIEIIDYYGAKLAHQFILQQLFNNWKDEYGYQNAPGEDRTADFILNRRGADNFMFECGITLQHLSLKIPHDTNSQKADDLWESTSKTLHENTLRVYADGQEKQPIIYFNKYMANFYDVQFRGMGVEKYWKDKNSDLLKQSQYFYDNIEQKLIEYWVSSNGRVIGLNEIERIIERIIEELRNIATQAKNRISHIQNPNDNNTINNDYSTALCNAKIIKLIREYGRLIRFRRRKNILAEATQYIVKLYKNKTDVIAYEFAIKNIDEIIKKLETLSQQIESIKRNINDCTDSLNDLITERKKLFKTQKNGNSHLSANVKMLYKDNSIENHFDILFKQKNSIQQCLVNFRRNITKTIDKPTFYALSEHLNEDKLKSKYLYDLNAEVSYLFNNPEIEQSINKNDKLIGRNVLDYFRTEFSNEKLRDYLTEIKKETGVYVKLSNTRNETLDETELQTYANNLYIIEIPTYRDDDNAEKYEASFTETVRDIFGRGNNVIVLNVESQRKNEITIFKAKKQMALRSFDMVSGMLHGMYESFIQTTSSWAEIGLHTEGNAKDFPKIIPFNDNEKEGAWCKVYDEEFLPYLLIASQTGHLQKNQNLEYIFIDNPSAITISDTTIISAPKATLYDIKDYLFENDIVSRRQLKKRIGNKIKTVIQSFISQKENSKNNSTYLEKLKTIFLKNILESEYKNDSSCEEYRKIVQAYKNVEEILH